MAAPTTCAFCKHTYVNPCDDVRKASCQNFLHLQRRPAKKQASPAKAKKGKKR
jgi:hypothetical protein